MKVNKVFILVAASVAALAFILLVWLLPLLDQDACLDAGGSWDQDSSSCFGAPESHRQLSHRGGPYIFLGLAAISIGMLIGFIASRLTEGKLSAASKAAKF